jgi:hypothetical protein
VTPNVDNGLHPWITVWFNPRATTRRAVDSGRRRDPVLVSAVWGLSAGVFFAAQPEQTFPPGVKPLIVAFCVVGGTLLMTGVIYLNGALRAWGGRKVGGKATTGELSEALALSMIPFVSWFVLGAVVAISIRLTYGDRLPVKEVQPAPLWLYPFLGLGVALFVWSGVLRRNCILEVQGFGAAQGRRAFWIGMRRYLLILFAVAALIVAPTAVSWILQVLRR